MRFMLAVKAFLLLLSTSYLFPPLLFFPGFVRPSVRGGIKALKYESELSEDRRGKGAGGKESKLGKAKVGKRRGRRRREGEVVDDATRGKKKSGRANGPTERRERVGRRAKGVEEEEPTVSLDSC